MSSCTEADVHEHGRSESHTVVPPALRGCVELVSRVPNERVNKQYPKSGPSLLHTDDSPTDDELLSLTVHLLPPFLDSHPDPILWDQARLGPYRRPLWPPRAGPKSV